MFRERLIRKLLSLSGHHCRRERGTALSAAISVCRGVWKSSVMAYLMVIVQSGENPQSCLVSVEFRLEATAVVARADVSAHIPPAYKNIFMWLFLSKDSHFDLSCVCEKHHVPYRGQKQIAETWKAVMYGSDIVKRQHKER